MHHRSIDVYDRFLGALGRVLAKAEAHCAAKNIKPEAILNFRLYPDMFSFMRQVQLTCDFATRGAARLAGDEPKAFPDTETSFAELQARIAAARAYVTGFQPERLADAAGRVISFKAGPRDMTLNGEDFLAFFSLPQLFFHMTTAYDILRHNGVELTKADYMGAT